LTARLKAPNAGISRGAKRRRLDAYATRPRSVGCMHMLAEQPIVVRMGADPEPDKPVGRFDCKGAVVSPHSRRPEAADLLEVERWVTGVFFQLRVRLVGEVLDM